MKFYKLLSSLLVIAMFSSTNVAFGNGSEADYGQCEMTISINNVGFENGVSPNNFCEPVIVGYFGAGNFHLSGLYNGTVEYSGQTFEISNPFSPNIHEMLTFYIVGADGEEVGDYIRFSGKTRLDTAIEVSKQGWPKGLKYPHEKSVILARADNPVDALAGSGLSGAKDAPILLTYPSRIDQSVLNEISRLKTDKIYLLGGTSAISTTVEKKLLKLGYDVERVAGATRFDTAANINKIVSRVNFTNTNAIIVNGYTVADALSASAHASLVAEPIYLANSDELPVNLPDTITSVDIYGGKAVISEKLSAQLESKGITVNRIAGSNRYATSVAAAQHLSDSRFNYILVRGESTSTTKQDYPDAVVASGLSHQFGAQIVLIHPTETRQEVKDYLKNKSGRVFVLGGDNAISEDVLVNLELGVTE
ncbi:cell wall-binding repeat-containing protein [Bacillus sp. 2205SS5-2]|uniref:cell wall-binding repeat-containing protein n=1 Tax=Bacillus sp. 2205SS5-2 TaxID=3109031 RepID=UPI003005A3A5